MSSSNGVSKDAFGTYGTAKGLAAGYNGAAAGNSSVLTPTLNQMIANPQGYGAQTIANMNTAAQQGAGGGSAATVGQGNLEAARTNNAGAFAPVAAQAGHDASNQLSDAALGIQNQNAQLQQQQRMEGIQGEQNMYNTNVGAGENALGLSNQSLGVANTADNDAFKRNMALWQTGAQVLGAV